MHPLKTLGVLFQACTDPHCRAPPDDRFVFSLLALAFILAASPTLGTTSYDTRTVASVQCATLRYTSKDQGSSQRDQTGIFTWIAKSNKVANEETRAFTKTEEHTYVLLHPDKKGVYYT